MVLEPSVLAMLRFDFKHLLDDQDTQSLLAQNSFEPLEVVWGVAQELQLDLAQIFPARRCPSGYAHLLPLALPAEDVQLCDANCGCASCGWL